MGVPEIIGMELFEGVFDVGLLFEDFFGLFFEPFFF